MDGLEQNFTAKRDDFNFPICELFHLYEPNSSSTFLVVKLISSLVARVTRRVSLVELELVSLQERLILPLFYSGICVAQSIGLPVLLQITASV